MDYVTLKRIRQKAVDNACWSRFTFWAFSEEQFKEGVKKTGAKQTRNKKWMMMKIPGGGFLTKAGEPSWDAFWANWDRYENAIKKSEKYIIDGLIYEYGNHEAQLGMGGRETAESYFPNATDEQKQKAWKEFWALCIKNDWF